MKASPYATAGSWKGWRFCKAATSVPCMSWVVDRAMRCSASSAQTRLTSPSPPVRSRRLPSAMPHCRPWRWETSPPRGSPSAGTQLAEVETYRPGDRRGYRIRRTTSSDSLYLRLCENHCPAPLVMPVCAVRRRNLIDARPNACYISHVFSSLLFSASSAWKHTPMFCQPQSATVHRPPITLSLTSVQGFLHKSCNSRGEDACRLGHTCTHPSGRCL